MYQSDDHALTELDSATGFQSGFLCEHPKANRETMWTSAGQRAFLEWGGLGFLLWFREIYPWVDTVSGQPVSCLLSLGTSRRKSSRKSGPTPPLRFPKLRLWVDSSLTLQATPVTPKTLSNSVSYCWVTPQWRVVQNVCSTWNNPLEPAVFRLPWWQNGNSGTLIYRPAFLATVLHLKLYVEIKEQEN